MTEDSSKALFREEAQELLAELESTLLELEGDPQSMELINRVFRALHTIKGSGSMFGFDEIAGFTHKFESVFDRVRGGEIPVTRELLNLSFRARDHVLNLLSDIGSEEEQLLAKESIFEGLKRVAGGDLVASSEKEKSEDASELDAKPQESVVVKSVEVPATDESKGAVADVADSEPQGSAPAAKRLLVITLKPKEDAPPADDFTIEPLLEELSDLGTVNSCETTDDPALSWTIEFLTDRDKEEVRDVFFFAAITLEVEVNDQADSASKPKAAAPKPKVATSKPKAPAPKPKATAPKSAKTAKQPESKPKPVQPSPKEKGAKAQESVVPKVSSLRVPATKLDKLVDLVGELVIVQAQISEFAEDHKNPFLTVLSENLERLSDELRDTTLGVRMLPIGSTFSKFRRLVRDVSAELGKEIKLVTIGAETEMDKTVLESLGDPFVHLLRNAMDHGIEKPEDREAAGKDRQGTIILSAQHSGGDVLLRIEDDGKGMDFKAVARRAVERGLIQEGADISERELGKIIFEPGFSLAKEVTNLSGRGVGMDVVKRAIEALRGSVDVESKAGQGMVITVRLPLTLAIIDGLQVRSGNEYYVIPLSLVEECVELINGQEIEEGGRRILDLRGEIVPYLNLREWFQVPGSRPNIEQVVVTGVNDSRIGIVVDDVIGEHQTVIKSLGKVYRDVVGVSGATIKGDGSIALILDVPGLLRQIKTQTV